MKDATEIVVVLDKSGSMSAIKHDAIGGFNEFLRVQQGEPGEANLTLVLFDTGYLAHPATPVARVAPLSEATYHPGGGTALLDALGRTITETGRRLALLPEAERPDKVIVVTLTDGEENSSREFSLPRVRDMLNHQQDRYGWKFLFLGADQDAFAEAQKLGVSREMAMNFTSDEAGMRAAYRASGEAVKEYRRRGAIGPDWKSDIH